MKIFKVLELGVLTKSNRIYKIGVVEEAIKNSLDSVKNRAMFVELDRNNRSNSFSNISHVVNRIFIEDNFMQVEIIDIKSPVNDIYNRLTSQVSLVINPVGVGKVDEENNVFDYRILRFSFSVE